ncbi:DoxX family protein [Haliangium ochraceum]|uniref:DoxX family protein n=1 Tax=Haliangium ochraceum (strain DSM 14365 / JCM 11303 / SMP-2) TaxID=502025 RepID=D0LFV7_HALO1|nr:DoxX family protein [Haliangium ochraceum]ACY14559.1 DoxX family protein [Haliangium ochraceum DSM 14365]
MSKIQRIGVVLIRVVIALMLAIHGIARMRFGMVDELGSFLETQGVPLAGVAAYLITGVEILGGTSLALGFFVTPLCAWFALQLVLGIVYVHASAGWFVVGFGHDGMEYSVVLIAALLAVALLDRGVDPFAPVAELPPAADGVVDGGDGGVDGGADAATEADDSQAEASADGRVYRPAVQ